MSRWSLSSLCAKRSVLTLVLLGGLWGAAAAPAAAQGRDTRLYSAQAVVRVTNIASTAKFINYGYREGLSILGGWIEGRSYLTFSTRLIQGVDYLLLAAGDNDAQDVDLEIVDANGNVLAKDDGKQAYAIVTFRPRVTAYYTLRLTLFKSRNNLPCVCAMTILKKNGWDVPVKNLDTACDKIGTALEAMDRGAQKFGKRVDFHRASNQWAFFGAVLREGENLSVTDMTMGTGDRLFVGAGDRFADTVRLDLETADGRLVKRDLKNGPVSSLDFGAAGGMHGLRVHNVRATGPAVVLMAVMDLYTPRR